MNRFRRKRDPEGKFALTSLQNPDIDIRPRLTAAQIAALARAAENDAAVAARAAQITAETNPLPPPPERTPEEIAAPECAAPEPAAPQPIATSEPLTAPTKPTRQFKRRRRRLPRTPASIAARVPARELTSLERHARKCQICKHPDREEIEQEFLRCQHPIYIAEEFNIPETRIIYGHARATGLFDRRGQNVRCALEFFIEEADHLDPSGDTIERAGRHAAPPSIRPELLECVGSATALPH